MESQGKALGRYIKCIRRQHYALSAPFDLVEDMARAILSSLWEARLIAGAAAERAGKAKARVLVDASARRATLGRSITLRKLVGGSEAHAKAAGTSQPVARHPALSAVRRPSRQAKAR